MKKTRTTEEVEQASQTAVAESLDWGQEMPTGFENTRPEDLGIPFLSLLQKGSPEVDEDNPEHATKGIPDAKAGWVINTLTREVIFDKNDSKPIMFLPITHEKLYQEWIPRNQGGGFVQSHNSPVILTNCQRNANNKDVLPNGHEIITTSYFAGFLLGFGEPIRCIIAMSSTQLKKARAWLNLMQSIKINGRIPPMYSHIYNLTTVPESNEKGNWMGWKIEIGRVLTKTDMILVEMAKQIADDATQKRLSAPTPSEEENN